MTGYGIIANDIFYPLYQGIGNERLKRAIVGVDHDDKAVADIPTATRRERPRDAVGNDPASASTAAIQLCKKRQSRNRLMFFRRRQTAS